MPIETADATATTEDDICFDDVLPPVVLLSDYIIIDDDVAVAWQLTEEEIIKDMTGGDNDSSGDDGDQLPRRAKLTVKEAAEVLSVLEDFCEQIPHGACATEHWTAIGVILAIQTGSNLPKIPKQILQTSSANKGTSF